MQSLKVILGHCFQIKTRVKANKRCQKNDCKKQNQIHVLGARILIFENSDKNIQMLLFQCRW